MREYRLDGRIILKDKLCELGFDGRRLTLPAAEGAMRITLEVTEDGRLFTEVTDSSGEEYTLHLVEGATGAFVGQVREDYTRAVGEFFDKCTLSPVQLIMRYACGRYGGAPEYLWKNFPDNAVLRRRDTGRWYAVIGRIPRRKLGQDSDAPVDIIVFRAEPQRLEQILKMPGCYPAYHMSKKRWFTVCLDGGAKFDTVCQMADESYKLAVK